MYFENVVFILLCVCLSTAAENETDTSQLYARFLNFNGFQTSIDELLVWKKNVIAALPFEIAMGLLDLVCSATIELYDVPPKITPHIAQMDFQYMTPCKNYRVPLLQAKELWKHRDFRKEKKVVILATGWRNTIDDSPALDTLWRAFSCQKDVNFVVVDAASYVNTLYQWAALNTEEIGKYVGQGLAELVKLVPLQNIHLIGHSLGAHVMGAAGRTFNKLTGKKIPRLTALDPAKPCFLKEEVLSGLQRGDAQLVDVIHTNPGILAKREPVGDLDFYPGGENALPPGCIAITCAHKRAVDYFAESAYPGNELNFMGYKCGSWRALKRYECAESYTTISPMGYVVNETERGIFYVPVNRRAPFGLETSSERAVWEDLKCHICEKGRNRGI